MASTMDKVKHALHLDKNTSTTHTTGTHTAGTHTNTHDNHHVGRDAALGAGAVGVGEHEHHKHQAAHAGNNGYGNTSSGVTGTSGHTTTAGPHNSNLLNKLDPSVDSDRSKTTGTHGTNGQHLGRDAAVGAGGVGLAQHEHHNHQAAHNGYGNTSSGITGTSGHTTTAGPHSSNLLNKLDPSVDSDRSKQHGTTGAYNNTSSHNTVGHTGTTGAGIGGTGAYNNTSSHNTVGHTGTTGGISHSTNAGPHNSNLLNKLDPRVDSDLSGRGGTHATPGSGTSQNTAGPHNSDMGNKMDPRVDADLDGSRTVGGVRTHY